MNNSYIYTTDIYIYIYINQMIQFAEKTVTNISKTNFQDKSKHVNPSRQTQV